MASGESARSGGEVTRAILWSVNKKISLDKVIDTFLFGSQLVFSPRLSLSISSALSDVPRTGNLKLESSSLVGRFLSCSKLSETGPSHKSVRMLSSDAFLLSSFPLSTGELGSEGIVGARGGDPLWVDKSSWKIGIFESSADSHFLVIQS
jgi:hypothetical protein